MRSLVVLVPLLAAPATARAECAAAGLVPAVLNTVSELPSDGGIVVAAQSKWGAAFGTGDVAVQSRWKLAAGGAPTAPVIDVLAPGLAVYRIAPANAGDVALLDGAGAQLAKMRATRAKVPVLAAPSVVRVYRDDIISRRGVTRVAVDLTTVPPTALALVIADEKGAPRSWGSVQSGKTQYPLYSPGCATLPNGTKGTAAGDKVTLFWVDEAGRASPLSKPIVVGTTAPAAAP